MDKIIAACGNNCSACPRHMPKSDEELHMVAQLWHRVGYRDHVVSNEEIQCFGCSIHNWCRYKIIECTVNHKVENCGLCANYPCPKIKDTFEQTFQLAEKFQFCCDPQEYDALRQAFFEKEENLNEVASLVK